MPIFVIALLFTLLSNALVADLGFALVIALVAPDLPATENTDDGLVRSTRGALDCRWLGAIALDVYLLYHGCVILFFMLIYSLTNFKFFEFLFFRLSV